MYYWLGGLVNSNLLEPGFLDVVRVVGFFLGLLFGYNLFARGPRRFAWLLIVFVGALCTKGLIVLCEYFRLYSWQHLQASPYFYTILFVFTAIIVLLAYFAFKQNKHRYKRHL